MAVLNKGAIKQQYEIALIHRRKHNELNLVLILSFQEKLFDLSQLTFDIRLRARCGTSHVELRVRPDAQLLSI
jgi:hypothetical protein